jgi:hypothetical protein
MIIRKVVILILLITVSVSCNYNFHRKKLDEQKNNCKKLEDLVNEEWKKDTKDNYYEYNEDFLLKIQRDYRECIIGLTQNELFKLFGQPINKSDNEMSYYFLNSDCLKNLPNDCKILVFYFHLENEKLFDYRVLPYVTHH